MSSTLKGQAELIFKNEEYKSPYVRLAIIMGQVGQVARFLYRDNKEKAKICGQEVADKERVREVGTKEEEETKIGEAIMHLAIYAENRGLDLDNGIARAFDRIHGKDWKEDHGQFPVPASHGTVYGRTLNINSREDLKKLENRKSGTVIAIMGTTEPDITHQALLNEWVVGVICSVGGKTSHPAVVARERGIPCLMNYKAYIKEGSFAELIVSDTQMGIYPRE